MMIRRAWAAAWPTSATLAALSSHTNGRLRRLRTTLPTIIQLAVTATIAFVIAHYALGHTSPALACTVALSSLSLNRDARPRTVAETACAMVMGITLSATVVSLFGRGPIQIAVTLLLVLSLATLVSRNPAFALSAATQSMLVAVLPDPTGGPYLRALDGVVGGCVALLMTALIPAAPIRRALSAGNSVIRDLADSAHLIALALESGDAEPSRRAANQLVPLQPRLDAWRVTLESARAVATFSPLSRSSRDAWLARMAMHEGLESASRSLRMVARRTQVITASGRSQPRVAAVAREIAIGIDLLVLGHRDVDSAKAAERFETAIAVLEEASTHASADQGLLAMFRQIIVDGLRATGMSGDLARSSLPALELPATGGVRLPRQPGDVMP